MVLDTAFLPFLYNSLATPSVQVDSVTCSAAPPPGIRVTRSSYPPWGQPAPFQILGTTVPEPSPLLLLSFGVAMVMLTNGKAWGRSQATTGVEVDGPRELLLGRTNVMLLFTCVGTASGTGIAQMTDQARDASCIASSSGSHRKAGAALDLTCAG